MISWILKKIVGSKNQREVKKLWPVVAQVNAIEVEYQKLSDDELRAKTTEFKQRIETARKMLQYSNLKIAEIAGIMEFSDVFSFSRFFFRNSGEYPSKFREQKQFKK